jgi:DNA-binding response OmpR family regulator
VRRILIIEDDLVTGQVVEMLLAQNGYGARIRVARFDKAIAEVNWNEVD